MSFVLDACRRRAAPRARRCSGSVLWPLALGFLLSACVETFVSTQAISRLLGRDGSARRASRRSSARRRRRARTPRWPSRRTLFRKGATLPNAIIFEFASTNLVFELGLALLILLGWQFVAAEFAGGLIMVVLLAVVFRFTLTRRAHRPGARRQADRGIPGKMEGHGAMDMSVDRRPTAPAPALPAGADVGQPLLLHEHLRPLVGPAARVPHRRSDRRLGAGRRSGRTCSSAAAASSPALSSALIGPLVALLSYVCSVGNVPLGGGAVAKRHRLRRRDRLHLRRPDHPADPQHLPQVLRRLACRCIYLAVVSYVTMVGRGAASWVRLFTAFGLGAGQRATLTALRQRDRMGHDDVPRTSRCWR